MPVKDSRELTILRERDCGAQIELGLSLLQDELERTGHIVTTVCEEPTEGRVIREPHAPSILICAGVRGENAYLDHWEQAGLLLYHSRVPEDEGFYLTSFTGEDETPVLAIIGGSAGGALYGLLQLVELIRRRGLSDITDDLAYEDAPVFKLRGPAIGLQLTHVEPPRLTYEYPITPARFPWFYDRELWERFLDLLLWNRCNILYLWTGQPFSSLVELEDYPEALEVTPEELSRNRDTLHWLLSECDRRGIRLILKFYSIHIPLPLAKSRGVELLQSQITPLNTDYTTKAIIRLIGDYPGLGLMVCLGEALRGTQNKTDWFLKVILPAVKEGAKQAHLEKLPTLILRGHDCDAGAIMERAVSEYDELYTMWKYNGESLTTWLPAGKWQKLHQNLSSHGQPHIMNVHVVANLEPFRYAAPRFIQRCVQAGHRRLGANGLHLYPLFFWDWPISPDRTTPRPLQMERDLFWYRMWFRYAWDPDRDPEAEFSYWTGELADYFQCDRDRASHLLRAMNAAGECAPRILRRIGITEGNRQTMSLGMTMSQLTNVRRYRPNEELWHSASTPGETPEEYVMRELRGESHFGETPPQMARAITAFSGEALHEALLALRDLYPGANDAPISIEAALNTDTISAEIGAHRADASAWLTDIMAIDMMSRHYADKLTAALCILRYRFTMDEELKGDLSLLDAARAPWERSLNTYRQLSALTEHTYHYACSMQTRQRKIPFTDGDAYGHWSACLPEYEAEYSNFLSHLSAMHDGHYPGDDSASSEDAEPLPAAPFTLHSDNCETFPVRRGEALFTDMSSAIATLAPELSGLTGIRFGLGEAIEQGVTLRVTFTEDVHLLVGYMNARGIEWLQVPDLETNTHADDRGGLSVVYANAVQAAGCPDVNIHSFLYEAGTHEIYLGTGGFVIFGAVPAGVPLNSRDAGLSGETPDKLDWLYEPLR